MATIHLMTVEELEQLLDSGRYELIRGELVEMAPPTEFHNNAHLQTTLLLADFFRSHGIRKLFIETASIIERDPDSSLIPDIAYVREDRLPDDRNIRRAYRLVPDLVVEVVSPSDRRADIRAKARQYADAGVRLVWVIDQDSRTVEVVRPGAPAAVQSDDDVLDGEDVFPGFRVTLRQIFDEQFV